MTPKERLQAQIECLDDAQAAEILALIEARYPLDEILPLQPRTFVPTEQVLARFAHETPTDATRFFIAIDSGVDQRPFQD